MTPKIAVYSCITGGKDEPQSYSCYNPGIDYFLFSDRETEAPDREIVLKPTLDAGPITTAQLARWHKIMSHKVLPEYDITVWLDGNIDIVDRIYGLIIDLMKYANMAMFIHPEGRRCIYDEIKVCKRLNKDDNRIMETQVDRYRKEKYPKDNGLNMTGVLIRRHKEPDVVNAMGKWWNELVSGSIRDQLSFNYVQEKEKLKVAEIQEFFISKLFKIRRHKIYNYRPKKGEL